MGGKGQKTYLLGPLVELVSDLVQVSDHNTAQKYKLNNFHLFQSNLLKRKAR
jgi:hypothetical protein